jgi:rubredoxin
MVLWHDACALGLPDTIGFILFDNIFCITMEYKSWMCLICGWIYDEALGDPEHGIPAGTKWEDVPMNWTCPECAARKEDFEMVAI